MLKKQTNSNYSTAASSAAAVYNGRPTEPASSAITSVKTYDGSAEVSITDIAESLCMTLCGTLDIPQGDRHTKVFNIAQSLGGYFGSDIDTIVYAMRNIAKSYNDADWYKDIVAGAGQYRFNMPRRELRDVLEQMKVIKKPSTTYSKSTTAISNPSQASASAAQSQQSATQTTTTSSNQSSSANAASGSFLTLSGKPDVEKIKKHLPKPIQIILSWFPTWLQPVALAMLWPILAVHASRARVVEGDGVVSRLILMACCCGEPASGKTRIYSMLMDYLLGAIKASDQAERDKLTQWIDQKNQSNNTTQLGAKPKPAVQIVGKCSANQLVTYMDACNQQNKSMLLATDEVSSLVTFGKNPYGNLTELIRASFTGSTVQIDSLSTASQNISTDVHLNVLLCGQPQPVVDFLGSMDGSATRFIFAFTEQNLDEQPVFKTPTDAQLHEVEQALDLLRKEDGTTPISLPRTQKVLSAWKKSIAEEVKQQKASGGTVDKAKFTLSIRSADIANRVSALIYILQGNVENANNEAVARYVAETTLQGLYSMFSNLINTPDPLLTQIHKNSEAFSSPDEAILKLLPDTFGVTDMQAALKQLGRSDTQDSARVKINGMLKTYIRRKSRGVYQKLPSNLSSSKDSSSKH